MEDVVSSIAWGRYQRLMTCAQARGKLDGYVEMHHILPRSHGGSDTKSNLVALTAREHYLAHWLLWRALRTPQMVDTRGMRMRSRDYAEAKESFSNNHPLKEPTNREAQRARMIGNKFPQEVLDRMSKSLSGRPPWLNGRVRPGSVPYDQWQRAGELYGRWLESGKMSVRKFSYFIGEEHNMTLENMIKKFRAGWVPTEDQEWLDWRRELEQ